MKNLKLKLENISLSKNLSNISMSTSSRLNPICKNNVTKDHINNLFNYDNSQEYKIKKYNKSISTPNYKNELSSYQRKILYDFDDQCNNDKKQIYINFLLDENNKENKINKHNNNNNNINYEIYINNKKNNDNKPPPLFTENKKYLNNLNPKENHLNSLKSDIFFIPKTTKSIKKKRLIQKSKENSLKQSFEQFPNKNNNEMLNIIKIPIISKFNKKINKNLNRSFDWLNSNNEIEIQKITKKNENKNITPKIRKLIHLNGSLDKTLNYNDNNNNNLINNNINNSFIIEDSRDKNLKENKNIIKKFYKNRSQSLINKQICNISFLDSETSFKNNLNNNNNNNNVKENELLFKNIDYNDISKIKKIFSNYGIHIFDCKYIDKPFNSQPTNFSLKIRENKNDKNFKKNFDFVKKEIKNKKFNFIFNNNNNNINNENKRKKNLNNVPINLKWNNTKNILYMKGRFENTQNPPFIRTTNTNEIINKNRKKQIEYSKNILNSNKIKKIN